MACNKESPLGGFAFSFLLPFRVPCASSYGGGFLVPRTRACCPYGVAEFATFIPTLPPLRSAATAQQLRARPRRRPAGPPQSLRGSRQRGRVVLPPAKGKQQQNQQRVSTSWVPFSYCSACRVTLSLSCPPAQSLLGCFRLSFSFFSAIFKILIIKNETLFRGSRFILGYGCYGRPDGREGGLAGISLRRRRRCCCRRSRCHRCHQCRCCRPWCCRCR